jgi:hypothetical protein
MRLNPRFFAFASTYKIQCLRPSFFLFLPMLFMIGCTSIERIPGQPDLVKIRQHFTNTSDDDAQNLANQQCSTRNSAARLIDFSKGCFAFCGTEYNYFTYRCVSYKELAGRRKAEDETTCVGWGFKKETEGFSNCMLRLYEVQAAVRNASETNSEIRKLTEQQRRIFEAEQAQRLFNFGQPTQATYPQGLKTPFTCVKNGSTITCY